MKKEFYYEIKIYTKDPVTIDIPDNDWNDLLKQCDNDEGSALFIYVAENINSQILENEYGYRLDWIEDIYKVDDTILKSKFDAKNINVEKTVLPCCITKK